MYWSGGKDANRLVHLAIAHRVCFRSLRIKSERLLEAEMPRFWQAALQRGVPVPNGPVERSDLGRATSSMCIASSPSSERRSREFARQAPLGQDFAVQPAPVRDAIQKRRPQPPGKVEAEDAGFVRPVDAHRQAVRLDADRDGPLSLPLTEDNHVAFSANMSLVGELPRVSPTAPRDLIMLRHAGNVDADHRLAQVPADFGQLRPDR